MTPKALHTLDRVPGIRAKLGAMLAIACAIAVSGCGNGDEEEGSIPSDAGDAIISQLDDLDAQVEAGKCDDAEATAQGVQAAVAGLRDLEADLEQALVRATDNLVLQTREDCEEPEPPPPRIPTGVRGAAEPPPPDAGDWVRGVLDEHRLHRRREQAEHADLHRRDRLADRLAARRPGGDAA